MSSIEFLTSDKVTRVGVGAADRGRTLLALAREHGVPILFTCEAGACAACLVRIEACADGAGAGGRALSAPTPEELMVLDVLGLSPDEAGAAVGGGAEMAGLEPTPPKAVYRLACQLRIGDGDLRVIVADDVDGMAAIAASLVSAAGTSSSGSDCAE